MYWGSCSEQYLIFSRKVKPTAKKKHECCECGRTIKIGEKYSYFVGLWEDMSWGDRYFSTYKICLECEEDWQEILDIFHNNGETEACIIFGYLRVAIQDAFDEGLLTENDPLVIKWLNIVPEVDISELSPEEKENFEKRKAVAQMKIHSRLLL